MFRSVQPQGSADVSWGGMRAINTAAKETINEPAELKSILIHGSWEVSLPGSNLPGSPSICSGTWLLTLITLPDSLCKKPLGAKQKNLKVWFANYIHFATEQHPEFEQFLSFVVAWEVQQMILSKHVLCDCANFRSACRSRPVFFSRKLRLCQGKSTDH